VTEPLPLQIQQVGGFNEQTLVLLHIAELQSSEGSATPVDVREAFVTLRLPPPSNVSRHLALLRELHLVMQPAYGRWAVTPVGVEHIRKILTGVDDRELVALGNARPEATFAETPHHLIPPELAPAKFQAGIARFLDGRPFDRNILCITRFPHSEDDPVAGAIESCRNACSDLSLMLHLASDRAVEEMLFGNVAAAMWACRYGIAIFEDSIGEGVNYNVVFEVGAMLMTGRRCLLLKDETVAQLPTDLVGHIYQPVPLTNKDVVAEAVRGWIKEDLGLA